MCHWEFPATGTTKYRRCRFNDAGGGREMGGHRPPLQCTAYPGHITLKEVHQSQYYEREFQTVLASDRRHIKLEYLQAHQNNESDQSTNSKPPGSSIPPDRLLRLDARVTFCSRSQFRRRERPMAVPALSRERIDHFAAAWTLEELICRSDSDDFHPANPQSFDSRTEAIRRRITIYIKEH